MMLCDDVLDVMDKSFKHEFIRLVSACIPVVKCVISSADDKSMNLVRIAFCNTIKQCISMFDCKRVTLS